jgi:hypothetical protein
MRGVSLRVGRQAAGRVVIALGKVGVVRRARDSVVEPLDDSGITETLPIGREIPTHHGDDVEATAQLKGERRISQLAANDRDRISSADIWSAYRW